VTRLANRSRSEVTSRRAGGDAAGAGDKLGAVPGPDRGELPLSLAERFLLVVGLSLACGLIGLVEPPSTSRMAGTRSRSRGPDRHRLLAGGWP
jgi:hypothetical protein